MIYKVVVKDITVEGNESRPRRETLRYLAFLKEKHWIRPMVTWASQQWAASPWNWSCFSDLTPINADETKYEGYFLFNHKDDAMLFKLTWHGDVIELPGYDSIRDLTGSL